MTAFKAFRPVFLLMFFWTLPLCSGSGAQEVIPVAASIFPVADMVKQVGAQYVNVTVVIPAGASPHTFEPRPSQVKKIASARVFFMVGAGLEIWADKFIKSSENRLMKVVLSEGVSLIHTVDTDHEGSAAADDPEFRAKESDLSHSTAAFANPHIWLDPEIAKSMVEKIIAALGKADPGHLAYYEQQGRGYMNNLSELDRAIRAAVEKFKIKKYVAFHPAWDYFARRYGLESAGVIEASPGRNPTPRQTQKIVEHIKAHHIQAVFAEPQFNPKIAQVIAKEAGVKVLMLDPIGGPQVKGRSTYLDLMRYNLTVLQEAMQ